MRVRFCDAPEFFTYLADEAARDGGAPSADPPLAAPQGLALCHWLSLADGDRDGDRDGDSDGDRGSDETLSPRWGRHPPFGSSRTPSPCLGGAGDPPGHLSPGETALRATLCDLAALAWDGGGSYLAGAQGGIRAAPTLEAAAGKLREAWPPHRGPPPEAPGPGEKGVPAFVGKTAEAFLAEPPGSPAPVTPAASRADRRTHR